MALTRKRRIGLGTQLAAAKAREAAAAQQLAHEEAMRLKAEREASDLAGGWAKADGTETIVITPAITNSSSETTEKNRREHRRTATVELVFGHDQALMDAIYNAAYSCGYASFNGIRWKVESINVPAIRERSLSFGEYGLTLSLTAMPRS